MLPAALRCPCFQASPLEGGSTSRGGFPEQHEITMPFAMVYLTAPTNNFVRLCRVASPEKTGVTERNQRAKG